MIEREFTVGQSATLKIGIRSGRVEVETGEPDIIRLSVDTRDPTFSIEQRGEAIVASSEKRGGGAYVTVQVAPMTDVEVATASGDVNVVATVGRLEASTAGGEVNFGSVTWLQAKSAGGSIRGARVEGEARCVTASGDIRIETLRDRANLSTASGDIVLGRCEGTIICNTVSGDIRVTELTGPSLDAKSMSGGVRIGIPPRTRLDLDANTFSGKVKLPSPSAHPQPPEREISMKVRLVSGDLRIDRTA